MLYKARRNSVPQAEAATGSFPRLRRPSVDSPGKPSTGVEVGGGLFWAHLE